VSALLAMLVATSMFVVVSSILPGGELSQHILRRMYIPRLQGWEDQR
jgi:hypothetical protein